jgi:hypothetical protein
LILSPYLCLRLQRGLFPWSSTTENCISFSFCHTCYVCCVARPSFHHSKNNKLGALLLHFLVIFYALLLFPVLALLFSPFHPKQSWFSLEADIKFFTPLSDKGLHSAQTILLSPLITFSNVKYAGDGSRAV